MNKTLVIIQARMSSTRMPGKILKPFSGGKNILKIQLEIIQQFLPELPIVVATTTNQADNAIADFCSTLGVDVFRGSEDDVLQRFVDCTKQYRAENIVRVCSDNPFLSGKYLKLLVQEAQQSGAEYFSFQNNEQMPAIKTHWGLFAEWVRAEALNRASLLSAEAFYHEHVTNYIYGNARMFAVMLKDAPSDVFARKDLRFTIDTPEDFDMAKTLYNLWDKKSIQTLVETVDANPNLSKIMQQGITRFTK